MKNPLLHGVASACLWLSLFNLAHAQSHDSKKAPNSESGAQLKQIRVQVEFIDVSHEQFTELMFGPKPPANDGELRQQVAQLVKDGKAAVVETLLCTSRSGQKATSESVEEFIYPTEYEPAELPNNIHVKDEKEAEKARASVPDLATGPTPTAFDTRNVGSTLEIEPTLSSDNKTIDLRFVPEIVYHVGNQVWAEWKGEHGNSPVQMPTFYTVRTNTAVTLADGHYMLTAALSPKNKEGAPDLTRKLMVFVKADVIEPGR
ncbi:MAG: hypothetical protein ABIT37_17240 [Luteolibacter sp.]